MLKLQLPLFQWKVDLALLSLVSKTGRGGQVASVMAWQSSKTAILCQPRFESHLGHINGAVHNFLNNGSTILDIILWSYLSGCQKCPNETSQ